MFISPRSPATHLYFLIDLPVLLSYLPSVVGGDLSPPDEKAKSPVRGFTNIGVDTRMW
jgi:hypothetical protein